MWKRIIWNILKPLIPFIVRAIEDALTKGNDPEEAAKEAFFNN